MNWWLHKRILQNASKIQYRGGTKIKVVWELLYSASTTTKNKFYVQRQEKMFKSILSG